MDRLQALPGLAGASLCILGTTLCCLYTRRAKHDGVRRTVLVTGAASGLGREIAQSSLAAGDTVVALDMDATALSTLSAASGGGALHVFRANVTDAEALASTAGEVEAALGPACIDAIVNMAGVIRGGPLVEMDAKDMELVMNVNVLGPFNTTCAFFPLLRRDGSSSPKVVNVASEVSLAWLSAGFNAPYSMSKFAVEAFSVALRQELSLLDPPVQVVTLNPGPFRTPMLEQQRAGGRNSFFENSALKPGTLFAASLIKGAKLAQEYMRKHGGDPANIGRAVHGIVHDPRPRSRVIVGATFEMRYVVPWVPQWVLDAAMLRMLR